MNVSAVPPITNTGAFALIGPKADESATTAPISVVPSSYLKASGTPAETPWESAVGSDQRLVWRECPAADQNHEAGRGQTRRSGNLAHEHPRAAVQPDDERKGAGALWTQDGGDLDVLTVAARAFDLQPLSSRDIDARRGRGLAPANRGGTGRGGRRRAGHVRAATSRENQRQADQEAYP